LNRLRNGATSFESAVDAVVNGDTVMLKRLLRRNPRLIRARSRRKHRATLLHYIGANGVEADRQKTPRNAVRIAEVLLRAGADVNAVGDMYGCSTALGLVATSVHPQRAGLQNDLIDVLLRNGAKLSSGATSDKHRGSLINACLANGQGRAAVHLAKRGAPLDLEGAAGIGRTALVKSFFKNGRLRTTATREQMTAGFIWACEYGHKNIVDFFLRRGIDVTARHRGQTGLHWAAHNGHAGIVKLLLKRGTAVNIKDGTFDGTPLDWALHGWAEASPEGRRSLYPEVVALLADAGAKVDLTGLIGKKVRSDRRMLAALKPTRR